MAYVVAVRVAVTGVLVVQVLVDSPKTDGAACSLVVEPVVDSSAA